MHDKLRANESATNKRMISLGLSPYSGVSVICMWDIECSWLSTNTLSLLANLTKQGCIGLIQSSGEWADRRLNPVASAIAGLLLATIVT
jgi:hypothetical protein